MICLKADPLSFTDFIAKLYFKEVQRRLTQRDFSKSEAQVGEKVNSRGKVISKKCRSKLNLR